MAFPMVFPMCFFFPSVFSVEILGGSYGIQENIISVASTTQNGDLSLFSCDLAVTGVQKGQGRSTSVPGRKKTTPT